MYGDIAVIQYSRKNGATCFYQALGTGQIARRHARREFGPGVVRAAGQGAIERPSETLFG